MSRVGTVPDVLRTVKSEFAMAKTLIVAEKPSVARDLAAALPGSFKQSKDKTSLEGDDHVVTWAVGHLVGLAEPDAYDPKLKKWRFADLPIVPDEFKLVPNDDRAKKQLNAIHKLMAREDVDQVINACDAGREGELIFAYVYETAKEQQAGQAPVAVLDDQEGDRRRVRARCATARRCTRSRTPPGRARRPTGWWA